MARLTIASVLAAAALAAPAAATSLAAPEPVHPATYASASGAAVLAVDPSERYGRGGARYELTRDGRVLWAGERPFTLLDARVADDGTVAGYSYDNGLQELGGPDALHLLVVDPAGGLRLDAARPRADSRVVDGRREPWVSGLVFDAGGDRVVFRVQSYNESQIWQPYRLSTGAALPPQRPEAATAAGDVYRGIVDAQALAGTPLTLVHWTRSHWKKDELGVSFSLIDANGTVAWAVDWPRDRQVAAGDRAAQKLLDALGSTSAILDAGRPRAFTVLSVRSRERVSFVVEPAGGAWKVRESGRAPWSPPAEAAVVLPPAPERALRALEPVVLGGGRSSADAATRGVHQFDLDERGRVGFAREEGCAVTFVFGDGDSFRETALGRWEQGNCGWPLVAWTGGNRWLVAMEYASGTGGWSVDAATAAVRPFVLPEGVSLRAVAGRPGGGLVLLGERDGNTVLLWMDADGRPERSFSEPAHTSEAALSGATDVAVAPSGTVAVLASERVGVFDRNGRLARTIELRRAWGREPRYLSGISPDEDDGFIVDDFGAPAPLVRMRSDGSVRASLTPRYADGRPTGRLHRTRTGPDGSLWASDGEALLRVGEDGVAEAAIGSPSASAHLGEIAGVALDASDRIHAIDRRTGAVHVFGADGKPSHVCTPDPGDVEDAVHSPSLTVTGDGRVFARIDGRFLEGGFVEFTPSGVRAASHESQDMHRLSNPATGGFWAVRWQEVALVDEKGRTERAIERRLDRRWLGSLDSPVVAPDGSIAFVEFAGTPGGSAAHVFAPDGTPLALFPVPRSDPQQPLAYDGHTVAFWHEGEVRFTDVSGRPIARFRPPIEGREPRDWPLFIAADGRELWMLDATSRTMYRYAMP
ncbi:MAG: hypothetical protein ABW221_09845 [Vicinamibacteria bacterium]